MAVDADLAMLIAEIEANASHAESITHGLSRAQFNWRPGPGRWSIGECLSHLNIVNGGDLAPLSDAIAQGRSRNLTGSGPYSYDFLSRKFISMMDLPVKTKMKAPKSYAPPPDSDLPATLSQYRRICSELRRLAESANGLNLARVKTVIPALPAPLRLVYKMPLGGRLILITTHDRRHLWQTEQVRNHPDFPSS